MFNFGTIGAYKQVRNNPRTKATAETKNGQVLVLDEGAKTNAFPTADEAQGKNLYVAFNIVDKPEIRITNDFKIEEGEFVRAFFLVDLAEMPVMMGHQVLADDYADVAKGDFLVPQADTGQWVKAGEDDASAIKVEVVGKTGFGDKGIDGIVRVGDNATP